MTEVVEPVFVTVTAPEEEEKEKEEEETEHVKIRCSVFFDGTCNNRTNTDQRVMAAKGGNTIEEKKAAAIYEKYKGVDSYENDYTNVAKMEKYIDEAKDYDVSFSLYVEGPGTDDNENDSKLGYGLGIGGAGVRAKVKAGMNKVFSKVTEKVSDNKIIIESLVLDIFGFSRGAAGARNFIHEALKGDELTPIKKQLQDKGYKVRSVKVRFAGLYDTVSSHGVFYFNDVSDLKLRSVRHAEKVVHLAAADEHRENFSLTTIASAGYKGREIYLPGVHSDIGGSYRDNVTEQQAVYYGPITIAHRDRDDLVGAGWYKKNEINVESVGYINGVEMAWIIVNRPGIKNQYSRIPLHIMARFSREEKINVRPNLERKERVSGAVLMEVKNKIEKYIDDTDPARSKAKESRAEDWHSDEDKLLCRLRHDYFHFSAKWEFGLKPRMSWWTSTRYRKSYSG